MKHSIFASLSILALSTTILPAVRAETIERSSTNKQNTTSQIFIAQNQNGSMLMAAANDGTPQDMTEEEWMTAQGKVSVSEVNSDSYTRNFRAEPGAY
jgi:hypothetical protein